MSSGQSTGASPAKNGSKLTPEELKHLLDDPLSITIEEDTLLISLRGCDEESCPVPERVNFFYCRRPPCPRIIVVPAPPDAA
jgi:hypothetical protein